MYHNSKQEDCLILCKLEFMGIYAGIICVHAVTMLVFRITLPAKFPDIRSHEVCGYFVQTYERNTFQADLLPYDFLDLLAQWTPK